MRWISRGSEVANAQCRNSEERVVLIMASEMERPKWCLPRRQRSMPGVLVASPGSHVNWPKETLSTCDGPLSCNLS